jgi:hypothetical protein
MINIEEKIPVGPQCVNSSFLSVDGMTCLTVYRFKAEDTIYRLVYHMYGLFRFLGYKLLRTAMFT